MKCTISLDLFLSVLQSELDGHFYCKIAVSPIFQSCSVRTAKQLWGVL